MKIALESAAPDWASANVKPLWEIQQAHHVDDEAGAPVLWPWTTMEPLVQAAIARATPAVAERRVLSLIDPHARPGEFHTIANLNAGLQVILPGEAARPHRHTADALRFVIDGEGAVTRVDGVVAQMDRGDLVLTPGNCWHEHWHEGSSPIVWLDVLNVHTHLHLGTMTFEPGPPHDVPEWPAEAVFRYPYADARATVDAAPIAEDGSRRMRYTNPLTGGPVMPFLDCYLVRLEDGQTTRAFTTSAHSVCTVVEGRGRTTAGETTIAWRPNDVFSLPSGSPIVHNSDGVSYIFMTTDRELYARLDLLTETYAP